MGFSTGSCWSEMSREAFSSSGGVSLEFSYFILKSLLESLMESTWPTIFFVGRFMTKMNFLNRQRTAELLLPLALAS